LYFRDFSYFDNTISYRELNAGYEILTLKDRKTLLYMTFLHGLIHGKINSSSSLSMVNIKVPARRGMVEVTFAIPVARTNVLQKSPIIQMMSKYNELVRKNEELNIFFDSKAQFKKGVVQTIMMLA